jgi:hypothetical protein
VLLPALDLARANRDLVDEDERFRVDPPLRPVDLAHRPTVVGERLQLLDRDPVDPVPERAPPLIDRLAVLPGQEAVLLVRLAGDPGSDGHRQAD